MKTPKPQRRRRKKSYYRGKLKWKSSRVDTQWQSLYRAMDVCQWSDNFVLCQIVIHFSLNAFDFWFIVCGMSVAAQSKFHCIQNPCSKMSRGSINYVLFVPNLCKKNEFYLQLDIQFCPSSSSSYWQKKSSISFTSVP